MQYRQTFIIGVIVASLMMGCFSSTEKSKPPLFTSMSSTRTGINFENELPFDKEFNIYTYRNYYNGGGVALGDINNDGLLDVYFTGNIAQNKLYLNKGDFKFEDITEKAGLVTNACATGVSIVDINSDGYDDIYISTFGKNLLRRSKNLLFINQHDLTFKEEATRHRKQRERLYRLQPLRTGMPDRH